MEFYWETHPVFVPARVRPCRVENSDVIRGAETIDGKEISDGTESEGCQVGG